MSSFLFSRAARTAAALALGALLSHAAVADEAAIRKNLVERLPNLPPIDEVTKTPVPGVYEVRIGTEIVYSDETGNYLFQGNLIDTKTRTSLTEARINKLTAIDFAQLPLKDAIVWKNGTGARKIAVFADPNCGYCKKFEQDLQKVKNITVYTFLLPVLGGDSPQKSENIWCSKDQAKTWLAWMLEGKVPPRVMGQCATPIERNLEFSRKYRINGTPAIIFTDGTRIPGAIGAEQIEKQLIASAAATKPGLTTTPPSSN
ncbi:DsbC family protein [Rhizobacter sp. J219]|jgi:thiol:disulfide interchange protein DsbC|uniref:DsbC family protein n=1 Tax=Rhizobacter sp. J219 TaxID=2898430 RepID=UPI00215122E6|nr:DsbC family protein [Rhizobacter sp. J219]MCR5883623.1 DsbC family protein [Rhizobacter sp. J219]